MAYSYYSYVSDGATNLFATPNYMDKSHISVTVTISGVTNEVLFNWINDSQISLVSVPVEDSIIVVRRNTPIVTKPVDYQNASILSEVDLDMANDFFLYAVQESKDNANDSIGLNVYGQYDVDGHRIINVPSSVDSTDAVNRGEVIALTSTAVNQANAAQNAAENARDIAIDNATTATSQAVIATDKADEALDSATQALAAVEALNIGEANGLCPLGSDGEVPSTYLSQYSIIPAGVIVLWSGSSAAIPSGWSLCDGLNGTPNLCDKFIVGAGGTYTTATSGGTSTHTHTGTVGDTTLTIAQMPSHAHALAPGTNLAYNAAFYFVGSGVNNVLNFSPSFATDSRGGGDSHNHTLSVTGSSSLPPYYALCYIMKL